MSVRRHLRSEERATLAGDLLRQLAEEIGDEAAVARTMARWHEVLGEVGFGLICMQAIRQTFVDCLVETPIADVPAGSVAFTKENP